MVPDPAAAAFRPAAAGRRPYISARTGPEGPLGSRPPPQVRQDWTALSVDGSHIDVDRHVPLRRHVINGETLIAGPLLNALRTVREVDAWPTPQRTCPTIDRYSPCRTAPWPFGTCSGASIPAASPTRSSRPPAARPGPPERALQDGRPVAVAAYVSRPCQFFNLLA